MLTMAVGVGHLLVGAHGYGHELRNLKTRLTDAPLWFAAFGLSLVLHGADIALQPDAVAPAARRTRGYGLAVLAAIIIGQRPRSGALTMLPVGIAMAITTRQGKPAR